MLTYQPQPATYASAHLAPASILACGFCGYLNPRLPYGDSWATFYRAVYCAGADASHPRLSGVGQHSQQDERNYLPPHAHQRFDDPGLDPLTLVHIADIRPPAGPGPGPEQQDSSSYFWGFVFHDACWSLLEQAVKPDAVDVDALWRILLSVPCARDLPNWGHNYGGLYMGSVKDRTRGEHFVLLGPNSNLHIPSTMWNPFQVPELQKLLATCLIQDEDFETNRAADPTHSTSEGFTDGLDPFGDLPQELKELILCYLDTSDFVSLRIASREFSSLPIAQQFFRSRFWPGQELHVFFDGFLMDGGGGKGALDWAKLYRQLKLKLKYNQVGLGERNRLRIWKQTINPLAGALGLVGQMDEFMGDLEWSWGLDEFNTTSNWRFVRTNVPEDAGHFGGAGRFKKSAEVLLPDVALSGVYVSLVDFFGVSYVSGLRFAFGNAGDVRLGYVLGCREKYLPVQGSLRGFHCAMDECGFRNIALITGEHMASEFLQWADDANLLPAVSLSTSGRHLRRIRGSFDGFRLTSLLVPGS